MIDERARHDLYRALEELLGTRRAETLMTLLPPVGRADVALEHDVHDLEARLDLRLDARFDKLDLRLTHVEGAVSSLAASTNASLDRVETALGRLEARTTQVENQVERALRDQTRALVLATVATTVTMTSLCLVVVGVAG